MSLATASNNESETVYEHDFIVGTWNNRWHIAEDYDNDPQLFRDLQNNFRLGEIKIKERRIKTGTHTHQLR